MYQLVLLLIVLGTGQGAHVHIQFFAKENYSNFLKEYTLNRNEENECHWLGQGNDMNVSSIKTDGCIMLFSRTTNCLADRKHFYDHSLDITSIRVDADMPKIQGVGSKDDLGSFQLACFNSCSKKFGGGSEVDVDFYTRTRYFGDRLEFLDVQGCRNLEKAYAGGKSNAISIDNHGHDIDLFEGEQCTARTMTLPAGTSELSKLFEYPKTSFDVMSFRPTNYQDHMKLEASIYQFEFQNATKDLIQGSREETVKLATDSTLRSNGASSLTQEFTVAGKVTKGMEYTIATGFSNMHKVNLNAKLELKAKIGVPEIMDAEITSKFSLGYQYQHSDTGSTSNRTSTVTEETISSRQQINIPPCTECVVSTFVKKVKDFPIAYSAYSRVTGKAGEAKMTALEVRKVLRPEMKYLGDFDDYTVNAMAEGTIFAEFGLNNFINADCKPIPNCVSATKGK